MDQRVRVCVEVRHEVKPLTLAAVIRELSPETHLVLELESLFLESVKGLNYTIKLGYGKCDESFSSNETNFCPLPTAGRSLAIDPHGIPAGIFGQSSSRLFSTYELMPDKLSQETSVTDFVSGFDGITWQLSTIIVLLFAAIMAGSSWIHRRQPSHEGKTLHQSSLLLQTLTWITALMLKQAGSLPVPASLTVSL